MSGTKLARSYFDGVVPTLLPPSLFHNLFKCYRFLRLDWKAKRGRKKRIQIVWQLKTGIFIQILFISLILKLSMRPQFLLQLSHSWMCITFISLLSSFVISVQNNAIQFHLIWYCFGKCYRIVQRQHNKTTITKKKKKKKK